MSSPFFVPVNVQWVPLEIYACRSSCSNVCYCRPILTNATIYRPTVLQFCNISADCTTIPQYIGRLYYNSAISWPTILQFCNISGDCTTILQYIGPLYYNSAIYRPTVLQFCNISASSHFTPSCSGKACFNYGGWCRGNDGKYSEQRNGC
jgi:hypothetical protein